VLRNTFLSQFTATDALYLNYDMADVIWGQSAHSSTTMSCLSIHQSYLTFATHHEKIVTDASPIAGLPLAKSVRDTLIESY